MCGKQAVALELLATVTDTGGQPIAVTTTDTVQQLLDAYEPLVAQSSHRPFVVDCLPAGNAGGERTVSVESPGDLSGIAMGLSDALGEVPPQRQEGIRVLVDNASTLLMYTETEPVYRFLHALVRRIKDIGGAVVTTLDTDGIDEGDQRALTGIFDVVVRVRRSEDATEFRVEGHDEIADGWHRYQQQEGLDR